MWVSPGQMEHCDHVHCGCTHKSKKWLPFCMLLLATTLLWNTSPTNTGSQNVPIRSGSSENSFDLKVNHYKTIKAWFPHTLLDLSTLASGLIVKN